jgi:hypothetical protein
MHKQHNNLACNVNINGCRMPCVGTVFLLEVIMYVLLKTF